jgi:hypothetical protein
MRPGAYRSQLIPYLREIAALRRKNPPIPYREIAKILNDKYRLGVTHNGVWQFVKARSKGRKVYAMSLTEGS